MKLTLKSLCIAAIMVITAGNISAQDLKSVLGSVAKNVIGDKLTTASSIIGTWTYTGPECMFESDQLLAKAGGEVTAKEVEKKLESIYKKAGMNSCKYIFNEDGTYSYTVKGKTVSGTYTFDDNAKTIAMKSKLGLKSTAYVTVTGNSMSLVFNADKLMSVIKAATGAISNLGSTTSAIDGIAKSYDGLKLGFELKKQ